MITEKLEKQYIEFINNNEIADSKNYVIQYSYINKIIEFATKENNLEKIEEYRQQKQKVEENLAKIGIKINQIK